MAEKDINEKEVYLPEGAILKNRYRIVSGIGTAIILKF